MKTTNSLNSAKLCVLTGASRGIGLAIAKACLAQGFELLAVSRSRGDLPPAVRWIAADLSIPGERERAIAEILKECEDCDRKIDLLVNNAGVAGRSQDGRKDWDKLLEINLSAVYHFSEALSPQIADGGRIINMGSTLSLRGVPDQPGYTAAKHGLLGLTRSFALSLAPRRITVNLICPGWTDTEMFLQRAAEISVEPSQLIAELPLKALIDPEEIAALTLYLASPPARNITGQALVIDAGSTL